MDPAPGKGALMGRGMRRRCPRCGERAFETWYRMREDCDRCGLHFEREQGYWVGAVIINTTVTFATFVGLFLILVAATWPDVPWGLVMGVTVAANVIVPVAFYPISKSLWLGMELSWHPLEPSEIEAASTRAGLPEYGPGTD